jgi:hypothetical protein
MDPHSLLPDVVQAVREALAPMLAAARHGAGSLEDFLNELDALLLHSTVEGGRRALEQVVTEEQEHRPGRLSEATEPVPVPECSRVGVHTRQQGADRLFCAATQDHRDQYDPTFDTRWGYASMTARSCDLLRRALLGDGSVACRTQRAASAQAPGASSSNVKKPRECEPRIFDHHAPLTTTVSH